jgi:hypothetical protein
LLGEAQAALLTSFWTVTGGLSPPRLSGTWGRLKSTAKLTPRSKERSLKAILAWRVP